LDEAFDCEKITTLNHSIDIIDISVHHLVSISSTYLRAAFMSVDPKSVKNQSGGGQYVFTLLGSTHVKAARKNVGEIDTLPSSGIGFFSSKVNLEVSLENKEKHLRKYNAERFF